MAYSPVTLYRRGAVRTTSTREEELRLRWEGWRSDLDDSTPIPAPELPSGSVPLSDILEALRNVAAGNDPGFAHVQDTPSASWAIPIPPTFGRPPAVTLYVDGAEAEADVEVAGSLVTIVFAEQQAGVAVLT